MPNQALCRRRAGRYASLLSELRGVRRWSAQPPGAGLVEPSAPLAGASGASSPLAPSAPFAPSTLVRIVSSAFRAASRCVASWVQASTYSSGAIACRKLPRTSCRLPSAAATWVSSGSRYAAASGSVGLTAPEAIEQRERLARVRAALANLPDAQREVIELHWFEDSPYDEIALIVGASVEAVRVRAHRGYARLRALLPGEV